MAAIAPTSPTLPTPVEVEPIESKEKSEQKKDPEICSICQENIDVSSPAPDDRQHFFHAFCLKNWIAETVLPKKLIKVRKTDPDKALFACPLCKMFRFYTNDVLTTLGADDIASHSKKGWEESDAELTDFVPRSQRRTQGR